MIESRPPFFIPKTSQGMWEYMRFFALFLALFVAIPAAASADDSLIPQAGHSATKPAPADEYFGRLKMSILGMRNSLVKLTRQAEGDPTSAESVLGPASMTEESIREWEVKYPSDPWLAKTVYMLAHLYSRVPTDVGREGAVRAVNWLVEKYPDSEFTNTALEEIHAPASVSPP